MMHAQAELGLLELAHKDVTGWMEADVREEFIAPLLRLLGYRKGTDYDVNREKQHLLSKPFLMIGSTKIQIDYQLVVRRRGFWLLEAKRPDPPSLIEEAILQAHFYAIHPDVSARYFGACNGREIVLFDVRTFDTESRPLLRIAAGELPERFQELRSLIGADALVTTLTDRVLADIRSVLSVEIREERIDLFSRRVDTVLRDVRPLVQENARAVRMRKYREADETTQDVIERLNAEQIGAVALEFPGTTHQFNVVMETLQRRVEALTPDGESALLQSLVQLLHRPLRLAHRFNVLRALLRLSARPAFSKVSGAVTAAIKSALRGYEEAPLARALWHLELNLTRVLYKSSFLDGDLDKAFVEVALRKAAILRDEDLIAHPPSQSTERVAWVNAAVDHAFASAAAKPVADVEAILTAIAAEEDRLEAAGGTELAARIAAADDMSFYDAVNRPWDKMRSHVFAVLSTEFQSAIALVDDEIVGETEAALRRVGDAYAVNHADVFWVRIINERGGMEASASIPPDIAPAIAGDGLRRFVARASSIDRLGRSALSDGVRIWGRMDGDRFVEFRARLEVDRRAVVMDTARWMR